MRELNKVRAQLQKCERALADAWRIMTKEQRNLIEAHWPNSPPSSEVEWLRAELAQCPAKYHYANGERKEYVGDITDKPD